MKRDDYGTQVRVYGRFPDAVKEKWESQVAIVDERRGPTLPDANEDNREEEVDTALVAHSVLEACQGFKNPSMWREFVIVSGDRDMCPAVDIIYGGDYPAPIHVWAWKETVKCLQEPA
ncbi:SnoaL-like domain-containing protein [Fusarium sp. Ph1]|nr:SnoaL-like domain-containing protein [Fusarium sp. Ph1]